VLCYHLAVSCVKCPHLVTNWGDCNQTVACDQNEVCSYFIMNTCLKMMCMYLQTFSGYRLCSILFLSTPNEIGLQKEWQHFMTNNVFDQNVYHNKTKLESKHKNSGRTCKSNPGHLAPQSDAFPLGPRAN